MQEKNTWQCVMGYAFIALVFSGVLQFFWPGFLSPDSKGQLNQAISGSYGDHHPPMMALYWKMWLWWRQGPEPIFLSHLVLLGGATGILFWHFRTARFSLLIPLIPLIPHVLFYAGSIWKDVGFAYTYLMAALLMAHVGLQLRRPKILESIVIWSLLFYGTGVKYQALFVLPVMTLWFSCLVFSKIISLKRFMMWGLMWGSLYFGLQGLQAFFIGQQGENHSWQYVKLYDLAGISVRLNKDVFPDYIRNAPPYHFDKVKKIYCSQRVDELLVGWAPEGSLIAATTQHQRDVLLQTWRAEVLNHPQAYLAHRFALWKTMVSRSPMKALDDLRDTGSLQPPVRFVLEHTPAFFLTLIKESTRFIYYVPVLILYFFLGLLMWRRNRAYALPLTMMTGCALTLMSALFIFSMASDLRYIYLTMVFFHFSHPFAAMLLFGNKEKKEV